MRWPATVEAVVVVVTAVVEDVEDVEAEGSRARMLHQWVEVVVGSPNIRRHSLKTACHGPAPSIKFLGGCASSLIRTQDSIETALGRFSRRWLLAALGFIFHH